MDFRNTTRIDSAWLLNAFLKHTAPYRHDPLTVRVRYSRGADFSGTCQYATGRILINIGRENRYPYPLHTHVARARSNATHWWRDSYTLRLQGPEHLALFIYLHELYHYLVHAAGRCTRRKEAMCDRFATRVLMDEYGCALRDPRDQPVPRCDWDIQDLEEFVAAAPRVDAAPRTEAVPRILGLGGVVVAPREIPVLIRGAADAARKP